MRSILLGLLLTLCAASATAETESIGRVVALRGKATIEHGGHGDAQAMPLGKRDKLHEGDVIKTQARAALRILMKDNSVLDVGPASEVTLSTYKVTKGEEKKKREVSINVKVGRLWARVARFASKESDFNVRSAYAVAGVRGTSLVFDVTPEGDTSLTVVDGQVEFQDSNGDSSSVGANQQTTTTTTGETTTGEVTAADVDSMQDSVRAPSEMDSTETGEMVQQMGDSLGIDADAAAQAVANGTGMTSGDGGGGTDGGSGGGESESEDAGEESIEDDGAAVPPIDLEPEQTTTRVHGRVEIRE